MALVPTMGAFHSGHGQLMRDARRHGSVVVSLFVNPTQFGPNEDYQRYPRNLEKDAEFARNEGVDVLFAPEVAEVYPRPGAMVHVPEVGDGFDGAHRPGHFSGVATVVLKLFLMVQPKVALFGLKDLQQCAVIARMVEDLNVPVNLDFRPTVREADGLAMSSRNAYLTPEERRIAPRLYAELNEAAKALKAGEPADAVLSKGDSRLRESGFSVDYFELSDVKTMRPTRNPEQNTALLVAARLGGTRLIDNVPLYGVFSSNAK